MSQFLCRLGLAVALSIAAFGVSAQQAGRYVFAHMFDAGSLPDRAAQHFVQLVEEYGHERLKIEVYGAAHLGDERNNLLQLKLGDIDFALTGDLVVSYMAPRYATVNMPFVYRSPEHALRVYDGPIGDAIRDHLRERHNIVALSWHYVGTRLLTANRPVGQLQDLAGLKLRLPPDPVWQSCWSSLGAAPRVVPFTELLPALKRKRVEAQENPPNFIRTKGLQQLQRYLILTEHMPQRQFILVNAGVFEAMPPADRQVVRRAASETSVWMTRVATEQQRADIEWLSGEGGMQVVAFDRAGVMQRIRQLSERLPGTSGQLLNEILAAD